MLSEITKLLKERGPLSVRELSLHFQIDAGAMDGMLRTLERKGRIEQIGDSKCASCKGCALVDPADATIYRAV